MANSNLIEIIINEEMCTGCRICQLICSLMYKNNFSPNQAYIQILNPYELTPKISFLEGCTKCGKCVRYCLYGALILKEDED